MPHKILSSIATDALDVNSFVICEYMSSVVLVLACPIVFDI